MSTDADTSTISLPDELVVELADILADALVADVRTSPNLPGSQGNHASTGSSPSGCARTV
jgi:hypothetical protein